jgi:hypothetical protein
VATTYANGSGKDDGQGLASAPATVGSEFGDSDQNSELRSLSPNAQHLTGQIHQLTDAIKDAPAEEGRVQ